jgi:uncharacterized protein (TIGR02594 family)
MPIARREIGVSTYASGQSNPRVTQYHADTNIAGYNDKASWCSSFVNWSLAQAGFVGTGSALARSWLDWGEPLIEPVPGCIAVLSRDDPAGWKGHVGFFLRLDDDHIHLLGGNQLGQVREHFYSKSIVLGYRWPAGNGLSDCKHQAANGQVMPGMSTAIIMP